jgi:hypothetical protein
MGNTDLSFLWNSIANIPAVVPSSAEDPGQEAGGNDSLVRELLCHLETGEIRAAEPRLA